MKILVFVYIYLLFLIGETCCKFFRNAAVTVIIDTDNNIEAIKCPQRIYAKRSDFNQKGRIVSFIKANFLCNIVFIVEPVGELPTYHVSISPQFNASLVGCVKFHDCYNLEIDQIKGRNIKFDIKASSPCLEEVLRFRFELKKKNNIIHVSETDVFIGSTPPVPTNLEYIWKNNTVYLVGILESVCKNIFKLSDYYAEYKIQRAKSITSDKVHCNIIKQSSDHLIYCKLIDFRDYPNIHNTSVCNSKVATYVYGLNSGISSKITKTSSLLAINKMHGISLLVDRMELNKLYVKFNSSIVCNPSLTKINLVVIYQKVNELHNKISKHVSCTSFHDCRFSLDNLSSGTKYNICVYQQDIFDNIYVHSGTSCIIGTTVTLPCVKASLVNTTKILEASTYWKASLSFRKNCNDRNVYTLVEVLQNNKTVVFNKTFNFLTYNSAKGIIKNLDLQKHYRVILKSCNFYGCQQNENIYLEPPLHHSKFNIKQDKDGKQKTTIFVISFSFLLVLIALCYLTYFLLKRRGKLTPPLQSQQQTSSANTELLPMQDNQNDMTAALEIIPENSTLV